MSKCMAISQGRWPFYLCQLTPLQVNYLIKCINYHMLVQRVITYNALVKSVINYHTSALGIGNKLS